MPAQQQPSPLQQPLLHWLRMACRNAWVAGVAHGAVNATTALTVPFLPAGADPFWSTVLGLPGWIVVAAVVAVLAATGALRPRPLIPAPLERGEPAAPSGA